MPFYDKFTSKQILKNENTILIIACRFDTATHLYKGFAIVSKNLGVITKTIEKRRETKPPFNLGFGGVDEANLKMARDFFNIPLTADVFKKYTKTLLFFF